MKQMLSLCICFLLIFALSACGGATETTAAVEENTRPAYAADAQNSRDDTRAKVSDWLSGLGY